MLGLILSVQACGGVNKDDPKSVAEAFLNAIGKMDYKKAMEYSTEDAQQMLSLYESFQDQMSEEDKAQLQELKFTIASVEDSGDDKIVTYTTESDGMSEDQQLILVKETDGWKVDFKKDM